MRALPRRGALAVAALLALCANVTPAQSATPRAPKADLAAMDLEQLMKLEVVVAASKRTQQTRDVPSFVSVISAEQIRQYGYRTLGDVLKTLAGFYVGNDRSSTSVGVRGFSRSSDPNSRVLVMVNGLRANDNLSGRAFIGEEFGVDIDLVERIEVIRGPSAAIYGSNAFFAVINVVTRRGASVNGAEVATSAASFGTFGGRTTYGMAFEKDVDVLVSATYSDSRGQDHYFKEYDSPATNNGMARDADAERFHKLLATVSKGGFSFQAQNSVRDKHVPTATVGTLFNDNRARNVDQLTQGSASYSRAFTHGSSVSARIQRSRWTSDGDYPYAPTLLPGRDESVGEAWGVEVDAGRAAGRHFFNVGVQYTDNLKLDRATYTREPYFSYQDERHQSTVWGLFAQDEVKLLQPLTLVAGIRYDEHTTFGSATSPRVGLIYVPGRATTVKLLAGRAYRAPNESELHGEGVVTKGNQHLRPERIETLELVAQRLIGGGVQVSAAGFRNRLSDLLSQHRDPSDNLLVFENADAIESKGVELRLTVNRGHGLTGLLNYAVQRTEDRATGVELTNSPRHMAKVLLHAPLRGQLSASLDAQYTSSKETRLGTLVPGYVVTNVSILAPRLWNRMDLSASIYNLLDAEYAVPSGAGRLQNVISQDGRSFRVKTTLHF
ncbi:MAG: TonB-dependent receptor [Cytophagaceae bacterium]|nr:TonB-dependent receptor [Gemmatimonadaceae bacterium]